MDKGGCGNQWFAKTATVGNPTSNDYDGRVNCTGDFTPYSLLDFTEQLLPKIIKPLKPIDDLYSLEAAAILFHRAIGVVRPIDPNDKIGPDGIGPNRVVSADDVMEYMVRFENAASASAPVQELILVDYLDPDLDWTTVKLLELSYGGRSIPVPPGSESYRTRDFPPVSWSGVAGSQVGSLAVDLTANVNSQIGRFECRLSAVDTNTAYFPLDALTGFLPPEDGTGRGEGYLRFTVKPKAGLPIGTAITNIATIVFDGNDPIATPPVWNIVGDVPSLAATIAYLPGQIMAGMPFTYSVGLTNTGTNAVTNVVLTNALPEGMSVVSATATYGIVTITNGIVRWDLGTVTNGFGGVLTVTVLPTQEGTFANSVFFSGGSGLAIYSSPWDMVVIPAAPRLDIRLVGGQVVLFWSTNYAGFHLKKTASLAAPAPWGDVTNAPTVLGAEFRVQLGLPSSTSFYRLVNP